MTDSARTDPFATDGRLRELSIWIWYPAVAGSTNAAAPYVPSAWLPVMRSADVLSQDMTVVRTNSLADAPLDGKPPVVVMMPGLGPPMPNYSALAEDLASCGYAVVGINPTGSNDVAFPDGRVVTANELGVVAEPDLPAWYAKAERVANVWVEDIAFVINALPESRPEFGDLDFDRVAFLGHSLGGAASFEACRQEPRCGAAVDLDGTLWTDVRHTGLQTPSLLIQAAQLEPCVSFCQAAATDFATFDQIGPSERLVVAGSKHLDFTDLGFMWSPLADLVAPHGVGAERMALITRDVIGSFLDEHIRDTPAGAFTAAVARYDELR
ncbi:MAG: alpha/beta hydrolase family protein [Aeromicrobium sp.]